MTSTKTLRVAVYVRLSGTDGREVSFRIPESISQRELLDEGFAIDGTSASQTVYASDEFSLSDMLRDRELELIAWFSEKGYEVEFK